MKTILLVLLATLAIARVNPFEPGPSAQALTDNEKEDRDLFTRNTLYPPKEARRLKSVTYTFQNIDGTLSQITVPVDKSIDWHR